MCVCTAIRYSYMKYFVAPGIVLRYHYISLASPLPAVCHLHPTNRSGIPVAAQRRTVGSGYSRVAVLVLRLFLGMVLSVMYGITCARCMTLPPARARPSLATTRGLDVFLETHSSTPTAAWDLRRRGGILLRTSSSLPRYVP